MPDTVLVRPGPKRAPERSASGGRPAASPSFSNRAAGWSLALLSAVARRPVPVLITLLVATGVGAVGWNATMLQPRKHPAPLFGAPPAASPPRRVDAAPASPVVPLPAPRPDPVNLQTGSIAVPPKPATAGADAIGTLIRSGEPARGTEAGRIAAAQRALTKLGFGPLKSDGLMGAGTKAAIERFERNRNLPATGVLGTRTARLLAQQAGIEID